MLVAQDARCVKVYRRRPDGACPDEPEVYAHGASFSLPELSAPLTVAEEVYDDILDEEGGRSLLR